jgi:hypothetical protein
VHVRERIGELEQPREDQPLVERAAGLSRGPEARVEGAAGAELGHDVERRHPAEQRRREAVEAREDVWVREHAQHRDLVLALGALLWREAVEADLLDHDLVSV